MKRRIVGIVGGMGPLATHAFYAELIRVTLASRDQDHLHVIIDADPSIPDRTAFLLGNGADPRPALLDAARRLERAGVELLVMPCNTAHAFEEEIVREVRIPLVPWIESAVQASVERGAGPVGVLATTGTLSAGIYQRALEARDLAAIVPEPEDQEKVMGVVRAVKAGQAGSELRASLMGVAEALTRAGARSLVLGCTELPLVASAGDPEWPLPTVDPAVIVARRVVQEAGAQARAEH